jgi:hypothetical protein
MDPIVAQVKHQLKQKQVDDKVHRLGRNRHCVHAGKPPAVAIG